MNLQKNRMSYHAFASRTYLLATCALIPIAVLLLQGLSVIKGNLSIAPALAPLLVFYFILADAWVLGGSCSGQCSLAEYLKSSVRGSDVLRKALIMDLVTRFVVTAIVLSLCTVLEEFFQADCVLFPGDRVLLTLLEIFTVYAVSTLSILAARHFIQLTLYLMFASLGTALYYAVFRFGATGPFLIGTILLSAACSVLFSVGTVKIIMNKMRRSYYDETVEI